MMSLFLALHSHAAKRGDGLLPEFLGVAPQRRDVPKAMNEETAASAEKNTAKPDLKLRRAVRGPVVL